jgi:hypothetical protein
VAPIRDTLRHAVAARASQISLAADIDNIVSLTTNPTIVPQQTSHTFTAVRLEISLDKGSFTALECIASFDHRFELHLQTPARAFTCDTAWSPVHEPTPPGPHT